MKTSIFVCVCVVVCLVWALRVCRVDVSCEASIIFRQVWSPDSGVRLVLSNICNGTDIWFMWASPQVLLWTRVQKLLVSISYDLRHSELYLSEHVTEVQTSSFRLFSHWLRPPQFISRKSKFMFTLTFTTAVQRAYCWYKLQLEALS